MFTKSYRLFSILGFRISIDLSWFFLAALIIWSLGSSFFPEMLPAREPATYYLIAAIAALGMFASIVFHELAHAIVARYYQIKIAGITLFIFGGVAELEDEPPTAKSEFLVAIAGPISSYVLAGALFLIIEILSSAIPSELYAVLTYLMVINLVLATFNLIPAFPLDGGRMLRATLWWIQGSLSKATRIASILGAVLGVALMVYGIYNSFQGSSLGGMWQILIGFFILNAASNAQRQMVVLDILRGVNVRELMKAPPAGIPGEVLVSQITEHPELTGSKSYFPVTENGQVIGLLQPAALNRMPPDERGITPVRMAASPLKPDEVLDPERTAIGALNQLRRARGHQAFVRRNGTIVGWIEARDIFAYIDRRTASKRAEGEQPTA
jgi:Zn-dependent protease